MDDVARLGVGVLDCDALGVFGVAGLRAAGDCFERAGDGLVDTVRASKSLLSSFCAGFAGSLVG